MNDTQPELRTLDEMERIAQDGPDGTYLVALAVVHLTREIQQLRISILAALGIKEG